MQATDSFKKVINDHLQDLAKSDKLFAQTLQKPNKNVEDCCTYILNEVKKSGKNGFADDEVFGMAVHYFDEDDLKPGDNINAKVVVNHQVGKKSKTTTSAATPDQPNPAKKTSKKPVVSTQTSIF